jgi:cytochrome P450
MEGAPALARWFGLAPRFDVMATLAKGPLCYTRLLGKRIYFVNDAEFVKRILLDNLANYPKSATYRNNLRPFLGEGMLISEGDFWKRQRRLAQPAFHLRRLKALAAAMAQCAGRMAQGWRHGETVDVMPAMNAVTMDIVARTLFGADVSGDIGAVGAAMTVLGEETGRIGPSAFFEMPEFLTRPRGRRFAEAVATLDGIVNRIVVQRRAEMDQGAAARDDLLSMLLEARDEETGQGMTDRQLRDELVTLFLAGHETTAISLTWTFHLLAQNPAAEAKLHAEVDEVLREKDVPAFDDLERLPYARMIAEESMRLYPPAYVFSRRAAGDDRLGEFHMPAGAHIVISPYALHRRADYWEAPEAFIPERFAAGSSGKDAVERPKHAYIPFGGGPRICIGNSFAMMEHAIVLATAARRWRLESIPGHEVRTEPRITLRPRGGLPMRVMLRTKENS